MAQKTVPDIPAPRVRAGTPEMLYGGQIARVYVWEVPIRVVHWIVFFSIIVLAFTGWYIHTPFIVNGGTPILQMATIRFIHEVSAFIFSIAVATRIFWFFVGNRYASWRAFLPLNRANQRGIRQMLKYYLFLSWEPPLAVGHNRLAGVSYLAVYLLMVLQIATGVVLYGWITYNTPLFGWMTALLDIQWIREIHYFTMFLFFAFPIHHVYSALVVSIEEKNGLLGSIFSGYKFVPACLLPEDERRKAFEHARDVRLACEPEHLEEYSGD